MCIYVCACACAPAYSPFHCVWRNNYDDDVASLALLTTSQNVPVTQHSKTNATLRSIVLSCRESILCVIGNCNGRFVATIVGKYVGIGVRSEQARLNTSVWKEHISDRNGVVIIRGNRLVDGPRKSRYKERYHRKKKSYLSIRRYAHHSLCVT